MGDFALEGLFAGVGIGQLVAAENSSGFKSNLQTGAASSLALAGLSIGAAVVTLVIPTSTETAYAVYVSGKSEMNSGLRISAGVVPIRGGAVLGLGRAF